LSREFETLAPELMEELAAAQIEIVCLDIGGLDLLNSPFLGRREHDTQGLSDALRNFGLYGEHILHPPVIALRPHRVALAGFHQLRGDAQAVPGTPYTAFEDVRGS
jgi:hypothetical protein